ncbi:hypothetical protein FRC17_007768 [Serendipita sp. 399]|nr:hypothetical protein FRC17_007768 [Serendipita sp. 399]
MYSPHQNQHQASDYFDQDHTNQAMGTPVSYGPVQGYPPSVQYPSDAAPHQIPYSGQAAAYERDIRRRYVAPPSPVHSSHSNGHFLPGHEASAGEGARYMMPPQEMAEYGHGAQPTAAQPVSPGYTPSGQMAGAPGAAYAHSSAQYMRESGYAEPQAAYYQGTSATGIPAMSQQHLSASHPGLPRMMTIDTSSATYQHVDGQPMPSPLSAPHSPAGLSASYFPGQQAQAINGHGPGINGQQPRPHVCDACGLGFARGHDLKRHKETHTNLKPHICECGKSFSRKDALRRHMFLKSCGPGSSAAAGGYMTSEE